MRFFCDRCKTRYTIDDAKVRGKVLKIRCKNCGNVMTVGDSGGSSVAPSAATASAAARARSHRHGGGLPGRSSGRQVVAGKPSGGSKSFDRSAKAHSKGFQGGLDQKTVLSDPGFDLAKIRREAEVLNGGGRRSAPGAETEPEEWYLADDHGQWGPMTFSELTARVKRGEPGPNPQVWRDGMEEWQDLHDVPELRPYVKHFPPPRAPTGAYKAASAPAVKEFVEEGGPTEQDLKPAAAAGRHRPVGRGPAGGGPAKSPEAAFFGAKDLTGDARRSSEKIRSPEPAAESIVPAGRGRPRIEQPSSATEDAEASISAFLGGSAGVSESHAGFPATVAPHRDSSRNLVIIFAVFGGVVALAMVALVVFVIMRDTRVHPTETPEKKVEIAADTGKPVEKEDPSVGEEEADVKTDESAQEVQEEEGFGEAEEIVMEELEISLSPPRKVSGERPPPAKKHEKPAKKAVEDTGAGSASLGSGFGTPGVYGSGGSLSVRRSETPSVDKSGGSRSSSGSPTREVTKPEVMAVVSRNVHRLKRCYEHAVRLHPAQLRQARLRVTFRVNTAGRVTSVEITPGKYRGYGLGPCIVASVKGWKFPPSTKPYGTVFPVNFVGR